MGFNLIGTFKCLQNANPFGLSSSGIHPIVIKLWSFLAPFIYSPLTSNPVNASWNVFPHEVARNYISITFHSTAFSGCAFRCRCLQLLMIIFMSKTPTLK